MDPFLINCNFCLSCAVDDRGTKKYYLEKCGNIFCESCMLIKICSKCGPNSSKRIIDRNMSADVRGLFENSSKKAKSFSSTIEYQFRRFKTQIQMLKYEKTQAEEKIRKITDFAKEMQKKTREQAREIHEKGQIIQKLRNQNRLAQRNQVYHSPTPIEDDRGSFRLNLSNGNM